MNGKKSVGQLRTYNKSISRYVSDRRSAHLSGDGAHRLVTLSLDSASGFTSDDPPMRNIIGGSSEEVYNTRNDVPRRNRLFKNIGYCQQELDERMIMTKLTKLIKPKQMFLLQFLKKCFLCDNLLTLILS